MVLNDTLQIPASTTASFVSVSTTRFKNKIKTTVTGNSQSNWWANCKPWIIDHWLLLLYIGGGTLLLTATLVVGVCWRKRITKRKEFMEKFTVQAVKPVPTSENANADENINTIISAQTIESKSAQAIDTKVENVLKEPGGERAPLFKEGIPMTPTGFFCIVFISTTSFYVYINDVRDVAVTRGSEAKRDMYILFIDTFFRQLTLLTILCKKKKKKKKKGLEDDEVTVKKQNNDPMIKREVRFAPDVDDVPPNAIAMKNMNQSESKFSDIYNDYDEHQPHLVTIFEKEPAGEMTPSPSAPPPRQQDKRDTMFSVTASVHKESHRDPEFSAIYQPFSQPNDYAAIKEHRNMHRAETQDTDYSAMYVTYPTADIPESKNVAQIDRNGALPSELKTRFQPQEGVASIRRQTYTTSENHEHSQFSQIYTTCQEKESDP
ncbi:hypothetical protein RFI_31646 [Reticulomyxa filosa]|uniref:Uncharacterized protein n=1 Tax=Reticulomyxa filosa TaxID=46433 RepID=X6LWK7_RETFI|nr:hypothetical protein RFI_31646 [Reticulomyxa filosa]|eukprot:ETO05751.1 hypothetical protein RFI_31646 [Reticulomyxa filosa]